jgi:Leucine-rich repeat (LRR) protein
VSIQILNLDHNQLEQLPLEIGNLGALQWLYLGYNQLQHYPLAIDNLGALEKCDLNNNPFQQSDEEFFDESGVNFVVNPWQ